MLAAPKQVREECVLVNGTLLCCECMAQNKCSCSKQMKNKYRILYCLFAAFYDVFSSQLCWQNLFADQQECTNAWFTFLLILLVISCFDPCEIKVAARPFSK
jgi:hypothetical protein